MGLNNEDLDAIDSVISASAENLENNISESITSLRGFLSEENQFIIDLIKACSQTEILSKTLEDLVSDRLSASNSMSNLIASNFESVIGRSLADHHQLVHAMDTLEDSSKENDE